MVRKCLRPLFVLAWLCLSLSLAFAPPAFAQEQEPGWKITVKYNVTGTGIFTNANGLSYPGTWVWPEDGDDSPNDYQIGPGESQSVTVEGNIKVVADWVYPDYSAAPNPPEKLYLLIDSAATWSATPNSSGDSMSFSGNASNNFDPEVTSSDGGGGGGSASGKHLIQLNGTSGHREKSYPMRAHFQASVPENSFGGRASTSISLKAFEDTRGVALTRQGARGETVDSDGTIHGDTRYSYKQYLRNSSGIVGADDYLIWNEFTAQLIGGWSTYEEWVPYVGNVTRPNVTWVWNPAYSGATINWNKWSSPFGSVNYTNGYPEGNSTGPSTQNLTYTVTENTQEKATATATYVMTFHDEWELGEVVVDDPCYIYGRYNGPQSTNSGSQTEVVPFTFTMGATLTAKLALTGGFNGDWIANILKWTLTGTLDLSAAVNASIATGPPIHLNPGMSAYPIIVVRCHHKEFFMKNYDAGGFVDQYLQVTDTFPAACNSVVLVWSDQFVDNNL